MAGAAGGGGGDATKVEKEAWRRLLVQLAALRGDRKLESFLTNKHPELLTLSMAGPRQPLEAKESSKRWFHRKLRGKGSPEERTALCEKLADTLRGHASSYMHAGVERIADALVQGTSEEGPLVCCRLAKELESTRFEGIWISREGPGVYRLGDEQLRVAVQVLENKLLVHGYFEDTILHPVRAAIRPFLAEYGPAALRSATDKCDLFTSSGGSRGAGGREDSAGDSAAASARRSRSPRRLPPGWVKREARSKPGVFYYCNESKGLTQYDRPADDA